MSHPSQGPAGDTPATTDVRPACLVAGCPCKDTRIVSHRRVAFFASLSRSRGETSDRLVPPDPGWHLPDSAGLEIVIRVGR